MREDFAARIVDTAVNPFLVIDGAGTVVWAGDSIGELLGVDAGDLVGTSVLELLAPAARPLALEALQMAEERTRAGAPSVWEGGAPQVDLALPDGRTLSCGVAIATPARTGLDGFVVQLRRAGGVGALHESLAAMAEGRPLGEVLEHLRHMAQLDLPTTRLSIVYGWEPGRLEAHVGDADLDPLAGGADDAAWLLAHDEAKLVEVADLPESLAARARAAGVTACWVRAVPLEGALPGSGAVVGWHAAAWRMTAFTEAALGRLVRLVRLALQWDSDRRALEWAASHDQLTGLHNRASFFEHLRGVPRAPNESAVLYLDLDGFKPVNDRHGHGLGDSVLAVIAERLRRCIRENDVLARLGGDEFAVLCTQLPTPSAAEALADRLIATVADPITIDGVTVKVGLSVGIALGDDVASADELLRRADSALRNAKGAGKLRWQRA